MGFGPAPAIKKLLKQTGLTLDNMDVIELNEAYSAQALAVTRDLGLADDSVHVNPNGGDCYRPSSWCFRCASVYDSTESA